MENLTPSKGQPQTIQVNVDPVMPNVLRSRRKKKTYIDSIKRRTQIEDS